MPDMLLITNRGCFKRASFSLSPRGPLGAGDLMSLHQTQIQTLPGAWLPPRTNEETAHFTLQLPAKPEWQTHQSTKRKFQSDLDIFLNSFKSSPRLRVDAKTSGKTWASYPPYFSKPLILRNIL